MSYVMTVRGAVPAETLGVILPHEHVLVDFSGEDVPGVIRFDFEEAVRIILPHLQEAVSRGVRTLVECTPSYLARAVTLLRRLSEESGLHIVTNTGYYGAAQDKFLPRCMQESSTSRLAEKWIQEWTEGIEGTGIRPGFIKIGVDPGDLSRVDEWIVRAAARTHRGTKLTIASHSTDKRSVEQQLQILEQEGVPMNRFIWVHAQTVDDVAFHRSMAQKGVWVEFDGIGPDSVKRHVEYVQALREAGLLGNVLVSHDAGWYSVGEPGGGTFRGFTLWHEKFLPALRERGFEESEIQQLFERNPARAFAVEALPEGCPRL